MLPSGVVTCTVLIRCLAPGTISLVRPGPSICRRFRSQWWAYLAHASLPSWNESVQTILMMSVLRRLRDIWGLPPLACLETGGGKDQAAGSLVVARRCSASQDFTSAG